MGAGRQFGGIAMAVMFMLVAIFLFSLWTPIITFCIQQINLWEFIFWTELIGFTVSFCLLRFLTRRDKVKYKRLRDLNAREMMIFSASGFLRVLAMGCLFISFLHLSVAGAISVYDFWPILALFISPALVTKDWGKVGAKEIFLSLFAFAGVLMLLYPETRSEFFTAEPDPWKRWGILLLPFAAGFSNALSGVIKDGLIRKMQLQDRPFLSIFVVDINYGFFCVIFAALSVFAGREFLEMPTGTYTLEGVAALLFFSLVIVVMGRLSFTLGLARATIQNISVLWFILPILTLFWLWLFGMSPITGEIILGASMITVANLLITSKPDDRLSYPATIITLLLVSIYCYFFEGLSVDDYYQAASVPLFFYSILIAFLMDRLIRRDRFEEDLVVEMIRHVENDGPRQIKQKKTLIDKLTAIVKTSDVEKIDAYYQDLRNGGHKCFRDVTEKLDALVLSRMQGANFGEVLVLFLVGMLGILMLSVYRPPYFAGDCFAIVLAAAIAFMFFMVVDLMRLRSQFFLELDDKGKFRMSRDIMRATLIDTVVSGVLVLVVILATLGAMWLRRGTVGF
ncbi:MAG: DMT family transporter [Alphaproteobacteria bacterium]|nr:MAG: DMT family transporter [Alphaproteobacteria bacterium]